MNNQKAFTLTELIIALGIIGTLAALTIPSIMKNINKKILSTQIKNTTASIQQLVGDQMVKNRTKILSDTDFSNPSNLLSSNNFDITYVCSSDNPCWASAYKVIKTSGSNTYTSALTGTTATVSSSETSVKLKNGVAIAYKLISDEDDTTNLGEFYIDVNGTEEPNVIGRDFFAFYLTRKGQIVGSASSDVCNNTSTTTIEAGLECFSAIMKNNWKMPDNDSDY